MKVKVTATLTLETDLEPEWCGPDGPKTEEEMIAWELEQATDGDPHADSTLLDILVSDGEISNLKIEKIEETATAQEAA